MLNTIIGIIVGGVIVTVYFKLYKKEKREIKEDSEEKANIL